jgi:hypothetical protein
MLVATTRTRRRSRAAAGAALTAALLAVAPAASAAPTRHPGRTPAAAASEQLDNIQAVSATDIWVLGQNETTSAPLVWHGNGRTWTQIPVPGQMLHGGGLAGIAATSPDSAWAVGTTGSSQTLILHWNGTAWSRQASPNAPGVDLLDSLTATSPGNAWAVGEACSKTSQNCSPLILHWNGTRWSLTRSPLVADSDHLEDVTATSPDNAWADGLTCSLTLGCPSGAMIVHWNGQAWASQKLPATRGLGLGAIAATSASDGWAFGRIFNGGDTFTPVALRWTGSRWATASPPARLVPNGVLESGAVTAPDDVWAVGLTNSGPGNTILIHWNGKTWSRVPSPTPGVRGSTQLGQVATLSRQDAWAVGSYCAKPYTVNCAASRPLLQHWNGKAWTAARI